MRDRLHHLRDPIHGFVGLTLAERVLVDSEPFQRLRAIRQLGLTSYVYPGAEHSRFQHAIGVMQSATRLFDAVMARHGRDVTTILAWNDDDVARRRALLRLAALLHDIGHAPFSHTAEHLLPGGQSHEDFTIRIIEAEPIAALIAACGHPHGFGAAEVASLVRGGEREPFLHQFLSGDLDADRMDYLLRDSHYTGVPNGRFDHERLIHMLTIRVSEDGAPHLAIDEGGLHVAEAMLLARNFMFLQVYFHPVSRAFGHELATFMEALLPGGRYPDALDAYLAWDDAAVMVAMRQVLATNSESAEHEAARRILRRDPLRLVAQTSDFASNDEVRAFDDLVGSVRAKFGGVPLFIETIEMDLVGDATASLTMRRKADGTFVPLRAASSLIASLRPIRETRLYVDRAHRDAVAAFCASAKR
ncbi:MAG: HD domain-containing protein [Deltaproteobacteria bacterium]|nr:HD domain-containing protein [Deltaproteobacteria bacterium]